MTQTHSVEAVLTARDNGFSSALQNAMNLINGVVSATDRLKKVEGVFKNLTNKSTWLGKAFEQVQEPLGELKKTLLQKFPALQELAALKGGKLLIALGKVGLAIACVVAAVALLVAWWRDLQTRNEEMADRFRAVWDGGIFGVSNEFLWR